GWAPQRDAGVDRLAATREQLRRVRFLVSVGSGAEMAAPASTSQISEGGRPARRRRRGWRRNFHLVTVVVTLGRRTSAKVELCRQMQDNRIKGSVGRFFGQPRRRALCGGAGYSSPA
ncbi:MAG: hypothetical protein M3R38_14350, partial [Actinomycetota bacterium]|nr:hypothetical protein [Actinomycetota bacterium]